MTASGFVVVTSECGSNPSGDKADVPQRPNVASAVSSWTCRVTFSTVLSSFRVTVNDQLLRAWKIKKTVSTLLLRADTLNDN